MMKRLKYSVLLVCLLAFTTTTAMAAPAKRRRPKPSAENISEYAQFGFRLGGGSAATTTYDQKFKDAPGYQRSTIITGYIPAVSAGVFGEYAFNENIAASLEINYDNSGMYSLDYKACMIESVVDITPLVKIYPVKFGEGLCLQLGLQIGKVMSSKFYSLKLNQDRTKAEKQEEVTDSKTLEEAKKLKTEGICNIIAGLEYTFDFDSVRFKLGSRDAVGILNRFKKKDDKATDGYGQGVQSGGGQNNTPISIMKDVRREFYIALDFSKLVQ